MNDIVTVDADEYQIKDHDHIVHVVTKHSPTLLRMPVNKNVLNSIMIKDINGMASTNPITITSSEFESFAFQGGKVHSLAMLKKYELLYTYWNGKVWRIVE